MGIVIPTHIVVVVKLKFGVLNGNAVISMGGVHTPINETVKYTWSPCVSPVRLYDVGAVWVPETVGPPLIE